MKPVFVVKAFCLTHWQANCEQHLEVNISVRTATFGELTGHLFAVNLSPFLWFPHHWFVFENMPVICPTALFKESNLVLGSLHYTTRNSVVLVPCRRAAVTGKGKCCSLYCMRAVKPLCETLSGAELVSCIKYLMSVCSGTLKHFQPSCLKALRNTWSTILVCFLTTNSNLKACLSALFS